MPSHSKRSGWINLKLENCIDEAVDQDWIHRGLNLLTIGPAVRLDSSEIDDILMVHVVELPELADFQRQLVDFYRDDTREDCCFHSLDKHSRYTLHILAQELNLFHHSQTCEGNRNLYIYKKFNSSVQDRLMDSQGKARICFEDGNFSMKSNRINALGNYYQQYLPYSWASNRRRRDASYDYHITLVNTKVVKSWIKPKLDQGQDPCHCIEMLFQQIKDKIELDWVPVGIGKVQSNLRLDQDIQDLSILENPGYSSLEKDHLMGTDSVVIRQKEEQEQWPAEKMGDGPSAADLDVAIFIIVDWPSAQELLKTLQLPWEDFHITIGFSKADIHNVKKDKTSRITHKSQIELKHAINDKK